MALSTGLFVSQSTGEIIDLLGMMMLKSPTFVDRTGYFPGRNIDNVFQTLNESLALRRETLGNDLYTTLRACLRRIPLAAFS